MSRGKAVSFELNQGTVSFGNLMNDFQGRMKEGLPKKKRREFSQAFNAFEKYIEAGKKRGGSGPEFELPYTDWYTGTPEGDVLNELYKLHKRKDYSWNSFKNLLEKQNVLGKFADKDKIDEYTNLLKDYVYESSESETSSSSTTKSERERQAQIGREASKAMETERSTGKKKRKAPSESVQRQMRLTKLIKLLDHDLTDADRNLLKRIVGSALTQYSNGLAQYKKKTDEQKKFLDSIRDELKTKKGTVSVAEVNKVLAKINLNDDDLFKIVSSFLSLSDIKKTGEISYPLANQPVKAYVTRLNSYIKSNATKIRESGKEGGTTFEEGLEAGTGKWETGSLLNLMEYLLTTKPEDMNPNRLGQLTDEQRAKIDLEISKKMIDEYESQASQETPIGSDLAEESPETVSSSEEEIEVEVPVEADPTGFKKITTRRETDDPQTMPVSKMREQLLGRLQSLRDASSGFKKFLDNMNDRALQEKFKRDNIHIQNEIQKKLPAVSNSMTDKQRAIVASVIQLQSKRDQILAQKRSNRELINQAILKATKKTREQLEREEPLTGSIGRKVGTTQRAGRTTSLDEEAFAEDITRFIVRLGGKSPADMNIALIEASEDESEPMSDLASVYARNLDFLLQLDTPSLELSTEELSSELSGSDSDPPRLEDILTFKREEPSAPTAEEVEKAKQEREERERAERAERGFMRDVMRMTPVGTPPTTEVTTTPVKLPEKLTDEETAKGTQRPKFISPSVNVLQPSEQDIQADFDEWAIFDFVQPVNNYGAEGNLNNNPLKRMARVEEETRFRNAGIDLQPALSSVFTNNEVNDNQSQLALDMLPPLMPDTSNQPRQVYNVSEYEVKSYDINNDRTAIEYQSPYDSMTPIVLTNDEIRRSVLYGRVP
jgi:hypothetical protein